MDRLTKICINGMQQKDLLRGKYKDRLKSELKEIYKKNEKQYFLDLYDKITKLRASGKDVFLENEHNLIVPYLMGICKDFDIDKDYARTPTELPDIDVDFLDIVRDYIKNEWAPEKFGRDYVSSIGTYTTYDIKNSLIDMTRIFNQDHSEVLKITKPMDMKDEDGNHLTWDKALEIYPAFKAYTEKYPEIADAAKRLCHRNRSIGTHPGGLIIANKPLSDFVPIVSGKGQTLQTAWVEGLAGQDLQAVGLIKFDLLVINNLMQIAVCTKLVKERHNISSICAKPGQEDWTDTSYLNDSKALEMANKGDLVCVFQFDSPGIRQIVRDGGVDSFDDLVAYTSIFRPGPLSMKMHTAYCNRKNKKEEYDIPSTIEPYLKRTYGVLVYQEQVLRILNVVGNIPKDDCEIVRKAISKKKVKQFIRYKKMFVRNGQDRLGFSKDEMENLWDQIEAFAGYGFNKSHAVAYTYISSQLLYLKAHYPEEFYTAILSCVSGGEKYAKLREYKREAAKHGAVVGKLDLNKSKENFTIDEDGKIRYGFSVVKGIGNEVAERIVKGQPYSGFEDFLNRFGTDAKVVQALIGLNVFSESDPVTLWKFYELHKDKTKKREARKKRYEKSVSKYKNAITELEAKSRELSEKCNSMQELDDDFESTHKLLLETEKDLEKNRKKLDRCMANFAKKEKLDDENPISLQAFDPVEHSIDSDVEELLSDKDKCELTFYGFFWSHPLENCKNYGGYTFDSFKMEKVKTGPVDLMITNVNKKFTKKDNVFYSLRVQDCDYVENSVIIWNEDYEIFKDDLRIGNLVRFRLRAPSGGFGSYLLDSPPRYLRHTLPDPDKDYRVVRLDEFEDEVEEPEDSDDYDESEIIASSNLIGDLGITIGSDMILEG